MLKKDIAKEMLQKRFELSSADVRSYQTTIYNACLNVLREAHHVGIYVSFNDEVDTHRLIQTLLELKIKVSVPKIEDKLMNFYEIESLAQLEPGHFGVEEPVARNLTNPDYIDLMIVPLLAFNRSGYRVGYGKGYYDKYLKNINPYKIGIAYDFQEVAVDFQEVHDVALDAIITNKGVIHVEK
ncbi:MAG: 5-formyltetrahydrofolate cyclo-ligase [Erysipelothrix sp.]